MKRFNDLELTDKMVERNDEIYNAVFELCRIMTEKQELEWDMSIIGDLTDYAAMILSEQGFKIRFYSIATTPGGDEYLETYFN